ncbi:MAG: TraB/GumN family protein [Ferruginibacter sp.]
MFIKVSIKAFGINICLALVTSMLFLLPGSKAHAQNEMDKPGIYYAITGNGLQDTSWLFGTYHLVNNDYLNELPAVETSFEKARGLIVEIEVDSATVQKTQTMGLMHDKTLTSLLDKDFRDSLDKELQQTIGASLMQVNQLKPMNVLLTLSIVQLIKNNKEKLNKYGGLPLDSWFVKEGKQTNKTISPLETVEEQMTILFSRTTDEEQVVQLKQYMNHKQEMTRLGDDLLLSWFNHDINKLYRIYEKTLQLSGESDYLVKERNDKWMKKLPGLLAREPQFIAVGALHLAGPSGLISQLQQLGYTVTALKP